MSVWHEFLFSSFVGRLALSVSPIVFGLTLCFGGLFVKEVLTGAAVFSLLIYTQNLLFGRTIWTLVLASFCAIISGLAAKSSRRFPAYMLGIMTSFTFSFSLRLIIGLSGPWALVVFLTSVMLFIVLSYLEPESVVIGTSAVWGSAIFFTGLAHLCGFFSHNVGFEYPGFTPLQGALLNTVLCTVISILGGTVQVLYVAPQVTKRRVTLREHMTPRLTERLV